MKRPDLATTLTPVRVTLAKTKREIIGLSPGHGKFDVAIFRYAMPADMREDLVKAVGYEFLLCTFRVDPGYEDTIEPILPDPVFTAALDAFFDHIDRLMFFGEEDVIQVTEQGFNRIIENLHYPLEISPDYVIRLRGVPIVVRSGEYIISLQNRDGLLYMTDDHQVVWESRYQ